MQFGLMYFVSSFSVCFNLILTFIKISTLVFSILTIFPITNFSQDSQILEHQLVIQSMDIAAVVVVGAQAVSQRLVGQARRRRTSYSPARGIISSLGASLVEAADGAV